MLPFCAFFIMVSTGCPWRFVINVSLNSFLGASSHHPLLLPPLGASASSTVSAASRQEVAPARQEPICLDSSGPSISDDDHKTIVSHSHKTGNTRTHARTHARAHTHTHTHTQAIWGQSRWYRQTQLRRCRVKTLYFSGTKCGPMWRNVFQWTQCSYLVTSCW